VSGVRERARRWIAADPDPAARAELRSLLDDPASAAELAERMSGTPTFGTAGMRAPVRAGESGMNRAVVVRTTAAVARWLRERGRGGGVVVVGRDARHGSAEFARDAAGVFAAAGFDVRALPGPAPTPVLAHAARRLNSVAAVQITASHNPPRDNGYKLYLDAGVQIVGPTDAEIEALIGRTGPADAVPRSDSWTVQDDALEEYLRRVAELPRGTARDLRVAATALHGVGAEPLRLALERAGFTDVHLVSAQREPDPDFPTVAFPNPEEPGATDAVLELAADVGADLALALDPDADRCAVGVPAAGGWRMLTGDETGVLLGEHVMSAPDAERPADPLVATTLVSSTLLDALAADRGFRCDRTLTGFKWLVRSGDGAGTGLVYAYEEALGHCVDPRHVRDKDGLSTAVLACDAAATAEAAGTSLTARLDALFARYGVHRTGQLSVRVADLGLIGETMRRLRAAPPAELAGTPVAARDLLPDADALVLDGGGLRAVVRPSGTEPKLKCYLQVVEGAGDDLVAAGQRADQRLGELRDALGGLVGSR